MQLTFVEEKETKGTIKFAESVGDMDEPKIGSLYVRKGALKELGYERGGTLVVSVTVKPATA